MTPVTTRGNRSKHSGIMEVEANGSRAVSLPMPLYLGRMSLCQSSRLTGQSIQPLTQILKSSTGDTSLAASGLSKYNQVLKCLRSRAGESLARGVFQVISLRCANLLSSPLPASRPRKMLGLDCITTIYPYCTIICITARSFTVPLRSASTSRRRP